MSKPRFAVCGFGGSGKALLDFILLREAYDRVMLFNDSEITDRAAQEEYAARGVEFLIGAERFAGLREADTIILSPGVNGRHERFTLLRQGREVLSEIEYAFRHSRGTIVGLTGSNGKSTTVSLIHHLLRENGRRSILAGNIGLPFIAVAAETSAETVTVLELSSFQLEEIVHFRPHVALLLNISPDHLDRYPDIESYAQAKALLFRNQKPGDVRILNAEDEWTTAHAEQWPLARTLCFGHRPGRRPGLYAQGDHLLLQDGEAREIVSLEGNPLVGVHNLENIMAAFLAGYALGLDTAGMSRALRTFRGLAHRMEAVGQVGEVRFVNDSKATNVDAALKSLLSLPAPLVPILGGKDKGGDFRPLIAPLRERAEHILLVGKAAGVIFAQLGELQPRCEFVADLAQAVQRGYDLLRSGGGIVLLAPACASFDMFRNFEHRGEVFAAEVQALAARIPAAGEGHGQYG